MMPPINGTTTSSDPKSKPKPKKSLILNAFVEMCSGHQSPGLWRHPSDTSSQFNTLSHWVTLCQKLEAGKFQALFIADVLGLYDVYLGPSNPLPAIRSGAQFPINEPLSLIPALAAATSSLGFGVTVSTSYEHPYHLARRLSTVDHLSDGRLAWNVVTGYLSSAAKNMLPGGKSVPHNERYEIAEEYMEVVYGLMNASWRDDAVRLDKEAGVYTDPARVRGIGFKGKYFEVDGPHLCQPSPQRTPVIMQAGTSRKGKEFAGRHAEVVFVSGLTPRAIRGNVDGLREEAERKGRGRDGVKVLAKFCPVLGRTKEEAEERYKEYLGYGDREGALALFGGWTGVDLGEYGEDEELRYVKSEAIRSYIGGLIKYGPEGETGKWTKRRLAERIVVGGLGATSVGTPEMVADEMERWVEEADVDGFNIAYAVMPQTFTDVVEMLVPELQRRGIYWADYSAPGGTFRENLFAAPGQREPFPGHPAAEKIWRAPSSGQTSEPKVDKPRLKGYVQGRETMDDASAIDPVAMQLG